MKSKGERLLRYYKCTLAPFSYLFSQKLKKRITTKLNWVVGVLLIALPLLSFFISSRIFLQAILLGFTAVTSLFLVFKKRCTCRMPFLYNILYLLIIVATAGLLITNSIQNVSFHLALIPIFSFYFVKVANSPKASIFIFNGLLITVFSEIILLLLSFFNAAISFYPNDSILSILLSCQFAFLAPKIIVLIQSRIGNITSRIGLLIGIGFLSYLILFLTSGRAGLLSFSITIFFLNLKYFRKSIHSIKVVLISVLVIFSGLLLFVKLESSNGRILIYKVVVSSIKPIQLLTGIGYGQFKAQYNHYQSAYFSKHQINNSEALLADNTYYAFNDPFQLILELGIIGLAVLLIFIVTLLKKIKSDLRNGLLENSTLYGAYLCIFSFLISSLFSYPLQVINILPLFLLSLAIVFGSNRHESESVSETIKPNMLRIKFLLYSVFSFYLLFLGYKLLNTYYKIKEAENLAKVGFKRKSVAIYTDLSNDMIVDENIYYPFALELSKLNKTDSAIIILEKSIKYIYNDHSALLLANLYYDKGQLQLADSLYKEAVFINPKSFRNRFALFTYYADTRQRDKSLYWGKSIIELKPKVPSETVTNIKKQTSNILQKLQQY